MAEATANAKQADAQGSSAMIRSLIIAVVLLLAGGGGAAYYFTQMAPAHADAEGVSQRLADPIYWPFSPSFVVNLPDGVYMRYLKVDIDLMTREPKLLNALDQHTPVLRNRLTMLFSSADYNALLSREGKEALQQAALDEINTQLEALDVGAVEALYFTNFVMQ